MRDRVLFFILGALLATFAYLAGDMHLSAHNFEVDGLELIPKLLVKELIAESIEIGFSDTYHIRMGFDDDLARIDLLSPNEEQRIALIVTEETGEDGALRIRPRFFNSFSET
jgi:hypothetical protein